ncbi:MAG: adenylate/guanylate cyclase domain-containing protein [Bacteroidales bacterium]|nr:adenylate/guanylate cyclase domain-containing protein [Bacteroidales bacterium]
MIPRCSAAGRFIFTEKEGLGNNEVRSILCDKDGNIWFGTNGGVTKFKPSEKPETGSGFYTHYTETEGLSNNNIMSVLEDQRGNIWFGSSGGGLTKFDGKFLTCFTKKEGLCDNAVMSVLEDKNGNLWIGTSTGISKLIKETNDELADNKYRNQSRGSGMFKNYTYDDGFYGVGCNSNSICEDNTDAIWIGANDRLTVYHPGVMDVDTIAPNIKLVGIDLFNEQFSWEGAERNKDTSIVLSNGVIAGNIKFDGLSKWYCIPENLSLPYDVNFLTFNFIGITTKAAQKVAYKYKLDGLGQNWSSTTNQTSASFGNLSHGEYTFRVKAMNGAGYWSKEYRYNLTIRPPWWKTNWAYLLYTMGFIAGIFWVDRIQTQRVIARERRRTRDRELEQAREIEKAYQALNLQHEIVAKQNDELEIEKKCSDELLLNILPSEVAEELKAKGYADAKLIDEVTVLFTDFVGFTHLTEQLSPKQLVAEIHHCFSAFDNIIHKHGVEKIKTIGDSYMAAGGLPTPNNNHAINTVKAALEIQHFMERHNYRKKVAGEPFSEIRIGLHSGAVIAGIVGVKKFAYDIWGDTVNTANHIEQSGDAGKVNISGETYKVIKDKFDCAYRGKILAKNKGMIDMYFVNNSV